MCRPSVMLSRGSATFALLAGLGCLCGCSEGTRPNVSLHDAARQGDERTIRSLLSSGVEIESRNADGETALHVALFWLQMDVAELLVDRGADLDARGMRGRTPLMNACLSGDPAVVEFLIENGASVNVADDEGATALHFVASHDCMLTPETGSILTLLLEAGAESTRDQYGRTPVHMAAGTGCVPILRALLRQGGDPNERDSNGYAPIQYPLMAGEVREDPGVDRDVLAVLLEYGADVDVRDPKYEMSLLHLAAWRGHEMIARFLIAGGSDIDARTTLGDTSLHFAAMGGHEAIVQLLVSSGADATLRNDAGETPASAAASTGHPEIERYLRAIQSP